MKTTAKSLRSPDLALLLSLLVVTFDSGLPTGAAYAQSAAQSRLQSQELNNRGVYYMRRNQFPEALAEFEKALDADRGNSQAQANLVNTYVNWGAVFLQANKFDEALEKFEFALKLDPYNPHAKHNIQVLKMRMARLGEKGGGPPGLVPPPGKNDPAKAVKEDKAPAGSVVLLTPVKKAADTTEASASGEECEDTPAPASVPAAAVSAPPAAGASLEDQLAAIEMKIYGHKLADMTVLRRLEKLETDTSGQTRTGTIKERIDALKKSYGL